MATFTEEILNGKLHFLCSGMQTVMKNSKPYGYPIHDCVNGLSRKLLWLINNNPVVPGSYFLKTVSKWNLVPDILRTDCGNASCFMASIQC